MINKNNLTLIKNELNVLKNFENIIFPKRASFGLYSVLKAFVKNQKNVKVALPGIVCPDVLISIMKANCVPFFCDINLKDGLISKHEIDRAISQGVKIFIIVNLYGNIFNFTKISEIINDKKYLVINDSAQSLGSMLHNKYAHLYGDVTLISFGKSKHINGGGGMILIKSNELFKNSKSILLKNKLQLSSRSKNIKIINKFYKNKKKYLNSGNRYFFNGTYDNYLKYFFNIFDPNTNFKKNVSQIINLEKDKALRISKMKYIKENLSKNFTIINFNSNINPWRCTFRLVGSKYSSQNLLSETIRKKNIKLSNWYMPVYWFFEEFNDIYLKNTEKLTTEIFQLWIDESNSLNQIKNQIKCINRNLKLIL